MPTYLITGANRGIGHGLLKAYLLRPNNTIIAAVRTPSSIPNTLPKHPSTTLIVVRIDSSDPSSVHAAVSELKSKCNVKSLDTVIANAAIFHPKAFGPIASVAVEDVKEHVDVNAVGPLVLFQAVLPLLGEGAKFVVMSSPAGSIGGMEQRPFPFSAYGASKAMMNYITRKIHFEHGGLVVFAVDPGFVRTDMGTAGAEYLGMTEAGTTVADSVDGLVKVVDGATREETSGRYVDYEGGDFPW